jgi:hypothetical protein
LEDKTDQQSNNTERQKAFEKQKDEVFEQKLWVFYKNMMERLTPTEIEKISKKSNTFCEQMDKIQAEYNRKKKEDKDGSSHSGSGSQNLEEYADSSLQEMLYGPNSSLDPDNFIQ